LKIRTQIVLLLLGAFIFKPFQSVGQSDNTKKKKEFKQAVYISGDFVKASLDTYASFTGSN